MVRVAEVENAQIKEMADPKLSAWALEVVMEGDRWRTQYLRDIFGNPFRPITINRLSLTPAVIQLAQAIYDGRAFDRLPILADDLHDAGCDNDEILSHCRGQGPNVRGCWVVDLILSKK